MVCSKNNLALVPRNNWWLDSGATSNISDLMQGCLSYQKPIDAKRYIYVGDGKSVEVEVIGHFRLLLCIGFYLDLKDTFVVLSFRPNLISISYLDKYGYSCSFENNQVNLSLNSKVIRTSSLMVYDNPYMLGIVASYHKNLNIESCGTKRKLDKARSGALWHKSLGQISDSCHQSLVIYPGAWRKLPLGLP